MTEQINASLISSELLGVMFQWMRLLTSKVDFCGVRWIGEFDRALMRGISELVKY